MRRLNGDVRACRADAQHLQTLIAAASKIHRTRGDVR